VAQQFKYETCAAQQFKRRRVAARETRAAQQLNRTRVTLCRNLSKRHAWHRNSSMRDLLGAANQLFKWCSNSSGVAIQSPRLALHSKSIARLTRRRNESGILARCSNSIARLALHTNVSDILARCSNSITRLAPTKSKTQTRSLLVFVHAYLTPVCSRAADCCNS
jgi:hypothetical protein